MYKFTYQKKHICVMAILHTLTLFPHYTALTNPNHYDYDAIDYTFRNPIDEGEQQIDQPTEMFIAEHPSLIVDWTPKAGCTCVWTTLLENYGLLETALKYGSWIHHYRYVYYEKHRASLEDLKNSQYYKIKFVRDPYKRAASVFIQMCYVTSLCTSFHDFLVFLDTKELSPAFKKLSQKELNIVLHHSQQQVKSTDLYMDKILKIEDCSNELAEVNKLLGLHLNVQCESGHHTHYTQDNTTYAGDMLFTKQSSYPPFFTFYSQETLRLVQRIYGKDIDNYKYSMPQEITDFLNK